MIQLLHAKILWVADGAVVKFNDGTMVEACPHYTPHYHVIAHRLGYGDDVMAYCREHEFVHEFLAEYLTAKPSYVLWQLAHGLSVQVDIGMAEEMAVQTVQRWLRANERPILGGVDWDRLKHDALELLCPSQPRLDPTLASKRTTRPSLTV